MNATFDIVRLRTVFGAAVTHDDGQRAATLTHTFGDEAFLRGHFPGYPVVPGVILLDGMILAALNALSHQVGPAGREVRSIAIDTVVFHRPVRPGMAVDFVSRLDAFEVADGRVSCKASVMVGASRHARASLTLLTLEEAVSRLEPTRRDHHECA